MTEQHTPGGIPAMCAEVETLRAQRDELAAALHALLSSDLTPGGLGGGYISASGDTIRAAKAALAKLGRQS